MILLDTDHTTFLKYPDSVRGRRMIERLNAVSASEVIGVGIVTVEERMRGWLAVIAKEKSARLASRELARLMERRGVTAEGNQLRPRLPLSGQRGPLTSVGRRRETNLRPRLRPIRNDRQLGSIFSCFGAGAD
jgi:hypothetical protein